MNQELSNNWWNETYGPQKMISDIVEKVKLRKSILIKNANNITWIDTFRSRLYDQLYEHIARLDIYFVDMKEASTIPPEQWIMNRFSTPEDLAQNYLPSMDRLTYIDQNNLVYNKYIHLFNLNKDGEAKWCQFIKCAEKNQIDLCITIESYTDISGKKTHMIDPILYLVDPRLYLTNYNIISFPQSIANKANLSTLKKRYYVELIIAAFNVTTPDNLINILSLEPEIILKNPSLTLSDIIQNTHYIIWTAQLRIFLPYIEEKRMEFIFKYKNEILQSKVLPYLDDYNQSFAIPEELELRHLLVFAQNHILSVKSLDIENLKQLKQFRNKIAHQEELAYSELLKLEDI